MTVKDLIKKLLDMDMNLPVRVWRSGSGGSWTEELDCVEEETVKDAREKPQDLKCVILSP